MQILQKRDFQGGNSRIIEKKLLDSHRRLMLQLKYNKYKFAKIHRKYKLPKPQNSTLMKGSKSILLEGRNLPTIQVVLPLSSYLFFWGIFILSFFYHSIQYLNPKI